MSGNSSVGNSAVYQADDQRTVSDATIEEQKKENRFHEGKDNSHKATDSSMFILPSSYLEKLPALTSNLHLHSPSFHPPQQANATTEDERSIKNKLEREEKRENESEDVSLDEQRRQQDATLPARAHGNEPSKGAKIDQQIREEEEAELKRKGKA
jgi:hypothetical protein